jgi:hypothetical protein
MNALSVCRPFCQENDRPSKYKLARGALFIIFAFVVYDRHDWRHVTPLLVCWKNTLSYYFYARKRRGRMQGDSRGGASTRKEQQSSASPQAAGLVGRKLVVVVVIVVCCMLLAATARLPCHD